MSLITKTICCCLFTCGRQVLNKIVDCLVLRIQLIYPKLCFLCLSYSLLSVAAIGWTGGIVWISRRARTQSIAEDRWYSNLVRGRITCAALPLVNAFQSWGKRLGISLVQRSYGHRRWRSYHTGGITVAWRWAVTEIITWKKVYECITHQRPNKKRELLQLNYCN